MTFRSLSRLPGWGSSPPLFPIAPAVRDLTFDAVFTVDAAGRFLDANAGATALVGYTGKELKGLDVRELIRHGGAEGERRPFDAFVNGGDFYWSGWLRKKDGSSVPAEARVARSNKNQYTIVAREKSGPAPAASTDTGDHEPLEITQLRRTILESLNHEFRTPLTAILGYSQIIKDVVEPEYESIIDDIERSGNRLLESFMTLIELARTQTGEFPLFPRILDVIEVVEATVERVEWLADERGLDLTIHYESRPMIAQIDEHALGRVLYSVLDNALKFTETGSVEVVLSGTSNTIEIEVHDTGVGISHEFMPLLYEAFTQESTGLNRIFQGAGMGLALTATLLQIMEGRILVKSIKGEGSTFTIILPRNIERNN